MTPRLRLILLLAGLALLSLGLVAIGYLAWPAAGLHLEATLDPAFFSPP